MGHALPVACDVQTTDGFIVIGFGRFNDVFEGFEFVGIFAIPVEEQSISTCFEGGFRASRGGFREFDDERGGSWFEVRAAFAYKTHSTTALRSTCLCKHV